MNHSELKLYMLALHQIPGIGVIHSKNLISYLGGIENVFSAGRKELLKVPGIGEKRCDDILSLRSLDKARLSMTRIRTSGIEILSYLDESYPKRLCNFNSSPILLYKKGNTNLNCLRTVGIIGTRTPTERGKDICEKIVEELKEYNVSIISGLAYGIDSIAHRAAVKNDMPTIAILGSSLDRIYPGSNMDLAKNICKNGALLSEFPLGTKPDRENFPKRNRIIAALSDALIVIESAIKGGSIITAEYANSYSKDVFAIPGRLGDKYSEGCIHLIKTHKAHLLSSTDDIAYITRWDKNFIQQNIFHNEELDGAEKQIFNLIETKDLISLDELAYLSTISIAELMSILLTLEFKGLIKSKPGKKYIVAFKN